MEVQMTLSNINVKNTYATACQALWATYGGRSSINAVRRAMIGAVNVALSGSGVPVVAMQNDPQDENSGTFQFNVWAIRFGGGLAGTVKSSTLFIDTVNTVYHEARHCEQWFRIAQALAAGAIRPPSMIGAVAFPAAGDAAGIANFMGIEQRIADQAVANPLLPPSVPLRQVQRWYDSIYGVMGNPRGERLAHINARYEDYRNLAEEQDAWRLGDSVGDQVREALRIKFPTLYDWKLATSRKWHFRSGRFKGGHLVGVDQAIENLQNDRSAKNFQLLNDAFTAWYDANKKERTKRDVALEDGEGIITKLQRVLQGGYAAWRMGEF